MPALNVFYKTKQAAAGRLLEPGIRARPSQFSQFLLQGTETNSLKRQRWKGYLSTVFPDQPGQKCGAVSKQQKKNKMKRAGEEVGEEEKRQKERKRKGKREQERKKLQIQQRIAK